MRRERLGRRVAVVIALAASTANAQQSSAAAEAEAAFREGRVLMVSGDLAKACAKFSESQRLDPAAGTLMNLAECLDKRGLSASALERYREAASASTQRGRADWAKLANEHADALDKIAPRVTLLLSRGEIDEGVKLVQDGAPAEANAAFAVDPGRHVVQASAPGREPRVVNFTVKNGDNLAIKMSGRRPSASSDATSTESDASGQLILGLVVGGIGVAGLAVGSVTGVLALGAKSDAVNACPSYPDRCASDGSGTRANDRATTLATISTISFVAGGALVAGGAVLFFLAPRAKSAVRAVPAVGQNGAGLVLFAPF
jgi:hypothetical protein